MPEEWEKGRVRSYREPAWFQSQVDLVLLLFGNNYNYKAPCIPVKNLLKRANNITLINAYIK